MLDVARHFFAVEDVKRFIDLIARYRLNRLHLHLTDDQGWRIQIDAWPRLVAGGSHYTQEEYSELAAYGDALGIMVVPEIDMPGHVNAALVAYPELAPEGVIPEPYAGTEVGFSSLAVDREETFAFVEDVVREVASLTPGPYFHIGGDEAGATQAADYVRFVERTCAIVRGYGKQPVGWEEIARSSLAPGTIVQHWKDPDLAREAVRQGARLIMSPASRTYFDMKYDDTTELGLEWARHIGVRDAYEWDPATQISGIGDSDLLGVEAALWSETLETLRDVEFMAFPRLLCLAEVGSSRDRRDWACFRDRIAAHGPQLEGLGVNFFRSPEIPWSF